MPPKREPLTPEMVRTIAARNVRCCEKIVANAKAYYAGFPAEDYELREEHHAYLRQMDRWLDGIRERTKAKSCA